LSIFLQQFQANKRVHDYIQPSRGRASLFSHLVNRLWSSLQCIKNFIVHGRADDERRRVSKPELLKAFGRELFRFAFLIGESTNNWKCTFVQWI